MDTQYIAVEHITFLPAGMDAVYRPKSQWSFKTQGQPSYCVKIGSPRNCSLLLNLEADARSSGLPCGTCFFLFIVFS